MIVVGVDPGARDTGITVVDYTLITSAMPVLVASHTINRPKVDGEPMESVPRAYLVTVLETVLEAVVDSGAEGIGVEGVRRPNWHHRGKVKPIDPAPLLATAQVVGALLGRVWRVPVFRIEPLGNGHLFPLTRYPEPLATAGKGNDKRRHERSAFDVAVTAAPLIAIQLERRQRSKPHA